MPVKLLVEFENIHCKPAAICVIIPNVDGRKEKTMGDKDNYKLIANNKKAYFDYFIEDTMGGRNCTSWDRSQVNPHGQVQHQGSFYPCGRWRSICLQYAHQSI